MWPFTRRPPKDPDPNEALIANHLGDTPPTVPSPAESLIRTLNTTQETLEDIGGADIGLLRDLITETETFAGRLSGMVQDLDTHTAQQHPSLDVYTGNVEAAYLRLKNTVGQSPDVIIRRFFLGRHQQIPALLAFVDGLVDNQIVDQDTLALMQAFTQIDTLAASPDTAYKLVHDSVVSVGHATAENEWHTLMPSLMGGNTLVMIEGSTEVLVLDSVKYPARSISTPTSERAVKGPQEAFNEVILTQMNLVRRRIKSPTLHFDPITLGDVTQTTVVVTHIEGLTNPEIVMAVKRRLSAIKTDAVQYSEELVSVLSSNPYSLFPQVRASERVDVVVRDLTQGKVAILVDNTPYALTVPSTFIDFYQTTEDYTTNFWAATMERIIRFLGLFVGLLLPPLYIALVSVNPDLLPAKLIITIAGSRVGIPFPPVFEVLIMWVIIEILREAAIRLPKQLSTTLGTVGAIVVGTAIVKAGIVSGIMIVTITLTALGLFTSPVYDMAVPWRVLFWMLIIMAYIFGLYGVILGLLLILSHMATIENFGVPYLSPFGPYRLRDMLDGIVRAPGHLLQKRPIYLRTLRPRKSQAAARPMANPKIYQAQKERIDHE